MTRPMVDIVLTAADHPDIEGWDQTVKVEMSPEIHYRVCHVERRDGGNLFDRFESLWVYLETSDDGLDYALWATPIFFKRPEFGRNGTLSALADTFRSTLELNAEPDGSPRSRELPQRFDIEARWGPESEWPIFESQTVQVLFDQLIALRCVVAEVKSTDPANAERLEGMLDNAFRMGRSVCELQLKNQYENDADRGIKSREQRAHAAAVAGKNRTTKKDAWLRLLSGWIQEEFLRGRLVDPTHDRTADWVVENWDDRPFSESGSWRLRLGQTEADLSSEVRDERLRLKVFKAIGPMRKRGLLIFPSDR